MKNVILISDNRFWRSGAGVWERTFTLTNFLGRLTSLTILYTGAFDARDREHLRAFESLFRVVEIPHARRLKQPELLAAIRSALADIGTVDVCITDKLANSFALQAVPAGAARFVDTHDLLSQKTLSFRRHGRRPQYPMSERQEQQLLQYYDGVICIQRDDHATVSRWLGPDRAILAPHPASISPQTLRDPVASIGFVASTWLPNVDGLQWFLSDVWPAFEGSGLTLDVYGAIAQSFENHAQPDVRFHGYAPSLEHVYAQIDIVINPVRFGSGLKIKTVEALGNGLPLVTTREGARGLTELDGKSLLIADDAAAFTATLRQLLGDEALRRRLGAGALAYAREMLTPEACFGELVRRIRAA